MKITLIDFLVNVACSTFSCPKGEHPHGGYRSHYTGGICY